MPVSLTMNGVAFASPSTPGFTPGMRVFVEVNLTVSDAVIALIDGTRGGQYVAAIAPTSVQYRRITGEVLGSGPLTPVNVTFYALQRSAPARGRLVSLEMGSSFYAGGAYCTTFAVVGASIVDETGVSGPESPDVGGLFARYYNNPDLVGMPAFSDKEVPSFIGLWGDPAVRPGVDASVSSLFSARWTGFFRVPTSGKWQLTIDSDDGSNLWFQGEQAINAYGAPAGRRSTGWLDLVAGTDYSIWIEYVNSAGPGYFISLRWRTQDSSGAPLPEVAIPGSALYASLPPPPTKSIVVSTQHAGKTINRY